MKLYHYQFNLSDLSLRKGDIERLMGYAPDASPEPFSGIINEVYKELEGHCSPQGGFLFVEDPVFDLQSNQTTIRKHAFHTGKIVTRMLKKSEKIALFICTAGKGIETWTKEMNKSGELVKSFVIDTFGSEIVEAIADKLHSLIKGEASEEKKYITNRYSPGYCGWPVQDQKKLFSFFPENFSGITLSHSSLMNPIKSVSGIIGIGENARNIPYTCDSCNDDTCLYRRLRHNT